MQVIINGKKYEALRITNDLNGNPRYVVHFLAFNTMAENDYAELDYLARSAGLYNQALTRAREIGGKVYKAKSYGGGIVFQSYNLQADMNKLVF